MNKNYYITTPIYYPSARPHMGHAYSSIIADFFARFKRIQGYKVFFLTGTDEHGQKIQRAAENKGIDPKLFCDEISKTFKNLSQILNLSNDDFIRTTEKRHFNSVEKLWKILEEKNEIYLSKYAGWYSVSDEAFYSDDEIETIDNNNSIHATINNTSFVGNSYQYILNSNVGKLYVVSADTNNVFKVGEEVFLSLDEKDVKVLND